MGFESLELLKASYSRYGELRASRSLYAYAEPSSCPVAGPAGAIAGTRGFSASYTRLALRRLGTAPHDLSPNMDAAKHCCK